jgi:hypothetical protein
MAARKRSARGRSENPSTTLIVFMVFFILLSIGLGVGTYTGYAGQKKLREDAESALAKAKSQQNLMEYYKVQALTARAAEGPLAPKTPEVDEANDWVVLMDAFEDGTRWKDEKTRPAMEELIKTLKDEKVLGWNAAEKKFKTTWAAKFKKQDAELRRLEANLAEVTAKKDKAEKELRAQETKYDTHWTELKKKVTDDNDAMLKASRERTEDMKKAFDQNKQLQDQLTAKDAELAKEKRRCGQMAAEKDAKIAELTTKVSMLEKKVAEQANAVAAVSANLQVGDFAGKWEGTLMRGGAVKLEIKAEGTAIWSVPGFTREMVSGVSRLEKQGETYVVPIQNQPVRLYLSPDRRTLRLSGGGVDANLSRK